MDPFAAEISDLIVNYDPATLERRDVAKQSVLAKLRELGVPRAAQRVVEQFGGDLLDRAEVDGVLVRSHLELQRLHEEFNVGALVRGFLVPVIDLVRRLGRTTVRVVDLGCGLGYIVRYLAARGELENVELVGVDYNRALITGARRLADAEGLRCTFRAANAFALDEPADIVMSTGVMHHFRGDDLIAVFGAHERSQAVAFVHVDIRPSRIAPLGSWIFHQSRMREPLARFDGYWSASRAHSAAVLRDAISRAAPSFALGMVDARPGFHALLQIFQAAIAVRLPHVADLRAAFAPLGRRFESP
jgi:2-polyprenyl-3-methyl-5-hydroxy-6-metoxy-1,4-benzoquinol methylase